MGKGSCRAVVDGRQWWSVVMCGADACWTGLAWLALVGWLAGPDRDALQYSGCGLDGAGLALYQVPTGYWALPE